VSITIIIQLSFHPQSTQRLTEALKPLNSAENFEKFSSHCGEIEYISADKHTQHGDSNKTASYFVMTNLCFQDYCHMGCDTV
jgi:hypothetical protein